MHEVDAYRLFAHVPGIIPAYDHAVTTERGADEATKTVYILLPYYRRGNLQDMINANLVNHTRFPEKHLMTLFLGICKALRAMHEYRAPPTEQMQMSAPGTSNDANKRTEEEEQGEQERPLMEGENSVAASSSAAAAGQGKKTKSFAHRDIKPGNIMIDDSGSSPIIMDLGSVAASPVNVTSQSVALQVQDTAAEHSTLPYRAPELFDVHTGAVIDVKTDIWSLGCTLFACLVGKSPFEMRSDETGGTLSMCIMGGDWRFNDETPGGVKRNNSIQVAKAKAAAGPGAASSSHDDEFTISEPIKHIVRSCLKVEQEERPDVNQLISMVEDALDQLP